MNETNSQTKIKGDIEAGNDFVGRDKHIQGDEVRGDSVGNDKIGQDKVGGDKVAGHKVVISSPVWLNTIITTLAIVAMIAGGIMVLWLLGILDRPFAPATSDETLIIIPLYDDRSEGELPGVNPSSQIYDLTFKAALENDTSQVRVEYHEDVISDSAEAQALGAEYNAKIVLWGWYNSLKVQPYVELIGEKTIQGAGLPIATPTPMAFYFLDEIPAQAAYLGLYLMGMAHFIVESPDDLHQSIAFFSAALDAVSISTKTNPWEAYIWRANCHFWLNEHAKAVPDYDQGILLNPEDASAYFNRGIVHGALGDHEQAIQDYTAAIDINPQYADAYFNRGIVHRALGDHEQAIQDYTAAIDINPQYADAYLNRGAAHIALGDHEQAIQDYTIAIDIDSGYMSAYIGRGYAYFIQEQHELAIDDLTEAIRLDPQYILAYRHRFHAYYALERYDETRADYQKALEIDRSLLDSSPLRLHPTHREEMEQQLGELE